MFVFGVGLGLTMQVLVVAVQNAVSYEDLGVATSSATFFRMIGGSFGTAVFGAIYAIVFTHKLRPTLAKVPAVHAKSFNPQTINPAILRQAQVDRRGSCSTTSSSTRSRTRCRPSSSSPCRSASWRSCSASCCPRWRCARRWRPSTSGEVQGAPQTARRSRRSSWRSSGCRPGRTGAELYQTLAQRAGIDLPPRSCWLLYRLADQPAASVAEVAERLKVDPEVIQPAVDGLVAAGMIEEQRRAPSATCTSRPRARRRSTS